MSKFTLLSYKKDIMNVETKTNKIKIKRVVRTVKKPRAYLNNADLLQEIEASRLSYCSYVADEYKNYDKIIEDLTEVLDDNVVYRYYTDSHIPEHVTKNRNRKRSKFYEEHNNFEKLSWKSFIHVIKDNSTDCGYRTVLKSHWSGGIDNGYFTQAQGALTDKLGLMIWQMATKLSTKSNFAGYSYREDFVLAAVEQGIQNSLKFDIRKTNNAFAYVTQILYTAMVGVINNEKKMADAKQQLLNEHGLYSHSQLYSGGKKTNNQLAERETHFNTANADYN